MTDRAPEHDDKCEAEFISGAMAYTDCGCADRVSGDADLRAQLREALQDVWARIEFARLIYPDDALDAILPLVSAALAARGVDAAEKIAQAIEAKGENLMRKKGDGYAYTFWAALARSVGEQQ